MPKALLFPGQGSQHKGMGKELYQSFPVFKNTIQEAEDILSLHLSKIMFDDHDQLLNQTQYTQPCLLAMSYGIFKCLNLTNISAIAGHSLGEYSALLCASAMDYATALKLVHKRGTLMMVEIEGTMAAIIGLDIDAVSNIVKQTKECFIANDNCPLQIVVSGLTQDVEFVMQEAKKQGAKLVTKLKVSGPFHSPFMKDPSQQLAEYLNEITFLEPRYLWYPNVLGRAYEENDIHSLLIQQMTGQVKFRETLLHMMQYQNIDTFYELGAGKVLSGLVTRTNPNVDVVSINTPQDIELFIEKEIQKNVAEI